MAPRGPARLHLAWIGLIAWILPVALDALALTARAELVLDVEQSQQKITILPSCYGLNLGDLIFVDLNHNGKDDLLVGGDASYGGDDIARFALIPDNMIRPEFDPYDLATKPVLRRYKAAKTGDFNDSTRFAKGDWNADGCQDVAISGRQANAVYILLGSSNLAEMPEQILGPTTVDVFLSGQSDAGLGREIVTADVNGDGIDDLLIMDSTSLYLIFGGESFTNFHKTIIGFDSADVTYTPWGGELGTGDLNHDGRDDLFRGLGNTTYVYLAKSSYLPHETIGMGSLTPNMTTTGFGAMVSFPTYNGCDLNGDGIDDLTIADDGIFKTLWGHQHWSSPITVDLTTKFDLGFIYQGYYGADHSEAGDINGDAQMDLAIGEDYTSLIHVLYGRNFTTGTTWNVAPGGAQKDDLLIKNGGYHFGTWTRIGNVLGQGTPQIAISAWASNFLSGQIQVLFLRPDVHQLTIAPANPLAGQAITPSFVTGWEQGQIVQYSWFINNVKVSSAMSLPKFLTKRGDQVRLEVQASLEGLPASSPITVKKLFYIETPPKAACSSPWSNYP